MLKYFIHVLTLTIALTTLNYAHAQTKINYLEGAWLGAMQIPDGPKLRIGLEIYKKANGKWGGNVASLDQNNRYISVSDVKFEKRMLTVQIADAPVSIKVKLDDSGDRFKGSFHEGSALFPIELKRVHALPEIERPQAPDDDVPYIREEVSYKSSHDNTWLSATLTRPKDDKKHPAVMLIAGSGPAHRDEYIAGHRPFKLLADVLTRQGFVVLRADKRGVYKSSGSYKTATQKDFAKDTEAAVLFLKSHKQVNANQINLIGHSEGSLIAAMTASKVQVNAIVSMAGPGMSVHDILLLQDQTEPAAKGATKTETDVLLGFSQRFYNIVLTTSSESLRKQKLQTLYDGLTGQEAKIVNKWNNRSGTLNVDFASRNSFSEMLKGNPAKYWQTVSVPVLILNGSIDSQVPAAENVSGIILALKQGNNQNFDEKIFSNVNHMFQKAVTGATDEYIKIEETINPEVIKTISTWLKSKT